MNRKLSRIAAEHYKKATKNLVILSNEQVYINCDIEEVVKQAESLGLSYEIVKGEYTPKKQNKKKNDSTGTN